MPPRAPPPALPDGAALPGDVAYVTDRWFMDRLPWAMWACVAGLAIIVFEGQGGHGAALAFVYLAVLGFVFLAFAAATIVDRSTAFWLSLPFGLAAFAAATIVVMLATGSVGDSPAGGTARWSSLVDPPPHVFGWMLVYLGLAYMAYALARHRRPGRPVILLTSAGVAFHRHWLKDLLVPWPAIRAAGPLEQSARGHPTSIHPNAICITVSTEFYERAIAPKRSRLAPPGAEAVFRPKGDPQRDGGMQMVLSAGDIVVDPAQLRKPIEERWTAFRERPDAAADHPGSSLTVYGRWAFDGSSWQAARFLAPLAAGALVLLYAGGLLPA